MSPHRSARLTPGFTPPLLMAIALATVVGCYTAEPQQTTQVPTAAPPEVEIEDVEDVEAIDERPIDIALSSAADAVPLTATTDAEPPALQTATVAGGCFWCTEAVFEMIEGVEAVESGYCNGQIPNPTYKEVCTGATGHAEAIRMKFDPSVVSYEDILHVFFKSHDPTTLNRQGADIGTQYRSGIYFHDEEQKKKAEAVIAELNASGDFSRPIVTEVAAAAEFYVAEGYHQDYFELNGRMPYCRRVIQPKVDKVRSVFADKLRQ